MPIKGLTDRGLSFPEIGQIRKGAKKSAKAPGKDLTYFRVEFDEREKKAAEIFTKVYGEQPTYIRIILPFDEIERMWDAWLEAYTAGMMVARSDGERYTYQISTDKDTFGDVLVLNGEPLIPYDEGEPAGHDYKGKPVFCKPVGRLKVIIPELERAAYLVVNTTSKHDIANISAQLEAFKQLNGGRLSGIPLILRRRPKNISIPMDDGKRTRMEKWLLSIEADPEWVKKALAQVKHLALPGNGFDLLPSGEIEEGDTLEAEIVDYGEEDEEPEEVTPDHAQVFWAQVNAVGLDMEAASAILKECGGDFAKAIEKLPNPQ